MRFLTEKQESAQALQPIAQSPHFYPQVSPNNLANRQISKFQVHDQENVQPILEDSILESKKKPEIFEKEVFNHHHNKRRRCKQRKSMKILPRPKVDISTEVVKKKRTKKPLVCSNMDEYMGVIKSIQKFIINEDPKSNSGIKGNCIPLSPKIKISSIQEQNVENQIKNKLNGKFKQISLKSPKILRPAVLDKILNTPQGILNKKSLNNSKTKSINKNIKENSKDKYKKVSSFIKNSNHRILRNKKQLHLELQSFESPKFEDSYHILKSSKIKNVSRKEGNDKTKDLSYSNKRNTENGGNPLAKVLPPLPMTPSNLISRNGKHRNGPKTILNFNINSKIKKKMKRYTSNMNYNYRNVAQVGSFNNAENLRSVKTKKDKNRQNAESLCLQKNLPKIFVSKKGFSKNQHFSGPKEKSISEKINRSKFPQIRSRKGFQSRDMAGTKNLAKRGDKVSSCNNFKNQVNSVYAENNNKEIKEIRSKEKSKFISSRKKNLLKKKTSVMSKIQNSKEIKKMIKAWNIHSSQKSPKIQGLYKEMFQKVLTESNTPKFSKIIEAYPTEIENHQIPEDKGQSIFQSQIEQYQSIQNLQNENYLHNPNLVQFQNKNIFQNHLQKNKKDLLVPLESYISSGQIGDSKKGVLSCFDHYYDTAQNKVFFGHFLPHFFENDLGFKNKHLDNRLFKYSFSNLFFFPKQVISLQKSKLYLFSSKRGASIVMLSKLLHFYNGNLDGYQIKKLMVQLIEIFMTLELHDIGIDWTPSSGGSGIQKSSFEGGPNQDFEFENKKQPKLTGRCKTERNETFRFSKFAEGTNLPAKNLQTRTQNRFPMSKNGSRLLTSVDAFNPVEHLVLVNDELRISFNRQTRAVFRKIDGSGPLETEETRNGLRKLLGLFLFNLLFAQNKALADIPNTVKIIEYLILVKSQKKPVHSLKKSMIFLKDLDTDQEEVLGYLIVLKRVSPGLLNILRKLLICSEFIKLYNLKEFFQRQEFGFNSMGHFSLKTSNLVSSFYQGSCHKYTQANVAKDPENFKKCLFSSIF